MNKRLIIILTGLWALTILPFSSIAFEGKDSVKIVILHTNDTHSRIESYPTDKSPRSGSSGYSQRLSIIKHIRKAEKNVLLFDAGDFFQGTPYFNYFKGLPEVKLMSEMKYDAVTLGNHEFDNGIDSLAKALQFAKFPIIVSNVDFSKTALKELTTPYIIVYKSGIKIGIMGLFVNPEGLIDKKNIIGILYSDPLLKAKETAYLLKNIHQCDMVICLSHLGHAYANKNTISDSVLAVSTSNIDLIIGGHTHKLIQNDWFVKNIEQKDVRIVQTGSNGINIGKLEYFFEKKRQTIKK